MRSNLTRSPDDEAACSHLLDAALEAELTSLLPLEDRADRERLDAFFAELRRMLNVFESFRNDAPLSEQTALLQHIAQHLRDLGHALERAHQSAPASIRRVRAHGIPVFRNDEHARPIFDLFTHPSATETLYMVAEVVEQARCSIVPSRSHKVSKDNAAIFVGYTLATYLRIYGQHPPLHQTDWFAEFVATLGKRFDLMCGPRIVKRVLSHSKNALMARKAGSTH